MLIPDFIWHPFRVLPFLPGNRWCRSLRSLNHRLMDWQAFGLLGRGMSFFCEAEDLGA